jgi:hypothetical protein
MLNLGVNRIRGAEQHHNSLHWGVAKRDLEPIPGQVRASDPEMTAELPGLGFKVALPFIGKLEVPLDQQISFKTVSGCLEQDLETVPGFRSRHVCAAKFDDVMSHGNGPQPLSESPDFTRRRHGGALRRGQIEI